MDSESLASDSGDQQMKQMLQSMDQINQNAHEIEKFLNY